MIQKQTTGNRHSRRGWTGLYTATLLFLCLVAVSVMDWMLPCAPSRSLLHSPHKVRFSWVLTCLIYNEAQYILEWVAWHRLLGVDHFFLYDHRSTDNPQHVLQPLIDKGFVTLIKVPETEPSGRPTTFAGASNFFRKDFPTRVRDAQWASHWDVDEFLFLNRRHSSFKHFLSRRMFAEAGGLKLSRKSAGTSGRVTRLKPWELASATFLDLENDHAVMRSDPGKITVNVGASISGILLAHKLTPSRGKLVNVDGIPATIRKPNGEYLGLDVPFTSREPFLIHHITRSYEDCKWKDNWSGDRQGTWRHKMPISICEKRNSSTQHYVASDYMKAPNYVTRSVLARKQALCDEMHSLNVEYCEQVKCCTGPREGWQKTGRNRVSSDTYVIDKCKDDGTGVGESVYTDFAVTTAKQPDRTWNATVMQGWYDSNDCGHVPDLENAGSKVN